MPTYAEIYDQIYANPVIEKTVVVACLNVANTIFTEVGTTPNHAERLTWAKALLRNPYERSRQMIPALVVSPLIQTGEYTDEDIQGIINTACFIFAGV